MTKRCLRATLAMTAAAILGATATLAAPEPLNAQSGALDQRVFLPLAARSAPILGQVSLDLVGQIGGTSNAVATQGRYAYLGMGPKLLVVDVDDPRSPQVTGESEVLPDVVNSVSVSGGHAYVATDEPGLLVIDVKEGATPRVVGTAAMPGAIDVHVIGQFAYVLSYGGLHVLDVTSPAAPTEVAFFDASNQGLGGLYVDDGFAYIAHCHEGLILIDVTDPLAPRQVDTPYFELSQPTDVFVADGLAYVIGYPMLILDVSRPEALRKIGQAYVGEAWDIHVDGGFAYVASYDGMHVVDVTLPHRASVVGLVETPGDAKGVTAAGGYVYLACWDGLRTIDVSSPTSPQVLGRVESTGLALSVQVVEDLAYVADAQSTLRVLDVSSPSAPRSMGFLDADGVAAIDVFVLDGLAYVAAGSDGLRIVDISSPTALVEIGSVDTGGSFRGVHVVAGHAYVTPGLRVLDVSSPSAARQVGDADLEGDSRAVHTSGGYAYVAAGRDGLSVVDVSKRSEPRVIATVEPPRHGIAVDVEVVDGLAYLAAWNSLDILDVSEPSSPTRVRTFSASTASTAVHVVNGFAHVAGYSLSVIDVSTPSSPRRIALSDQPGFATDVQRADGYVYVAASRAGLLIYRVNER